MKLQVGMQAPDFVYEGGTLHQTPGKKIVFFYPKAFTPGCTNEVRSIQSEYDVLRENGYTVIGVSMDKPDKQSKFAEACAVDYTLVPDARGEITKKYGVKLGFSILSAAKRVTFIIDEENRITDIWNLGLKGNNTLLGLKSHGQELLERLNISH